MQPNSFIYLRVELSWWAISMLVVAGILTPVFLSLEHYPFYFINVLFVLCFITLSRYIFLLKFTFLPRFQILKIALVFASIPLIFYLIQELHYFHAYLDEEGLDALVGELPYKKRHNMAKYIRNEMLLFGVGSVISAMLFPLRLIHSVWQYHNL